MGKYRYVGDGMTEKKRFSLGEDGAWTWVIDHTELDNGYDGQLTASECVDLLNTLHEENQRLKKAEILANHRGEMISFADSLIDDLGSETMKEMWDKFKNEKYEKWCELE